MQFSTIILAAASAASVILATPISTIDMVLERDDSTTNTTTPAAGAKSDAANDGMTVAACETNVAAQQTACLATCSTPECYAIWYVSPALVTGPVY